MGESTVSRVRTTGMHCASCVKLVQMSVEELEGIEAVDVDLEGGVTEVRYDVSSADIERIIGKIEEAGYGAEPIE
jgi:copper chaperone CopZ